MKKLFITLAVLALFASLFVVGASAKELYLEEFPADLRIDGDTVTHLLVIEGEEYYGGGNGIVNSFKSAKISEEIAKLASEGGALYNLGYTASDLGTKYLTKLIIPGTYNSKTVTNVDINNGGTFKTNTYFRNCAYLVFPSSMTSTNDANQNNGNIRCIDFGENSCLTEIPYYFMNCARNLIRLKNMPKNLNVIKEGAFMGCDKLQGDENRQLYIGAKAVDYKAFDCALINVNSIVFGENVQTLANQSFSNSNGNPGVEYIEFKCDVTKVAFPANSTTTDHTGAFYFGTISNQRSAYSNLRCIILSNSAQAGCDGKTFRAVSGQDVFFNDTKGEDDFVYTSHAMESLNGCFEACTRCELTRIKDNPNHSSVYTYTKKDGSTLSYLETIYVNFECSVCGTSNNAETIDPIFESLGFSVQENSNIGSISHKVRVNLTALKKYEQLSGKTLNYGVVAGIKGETSTGKLIDVENGELKDSENSVFADMAGTEYTIIEQKISGINENVQIYCNAFVCDGASVTYIFDKQEESSAIEYQITLK